MFPAATRDEPENYSWLWQLAFLVILDVFHWRHSSQTPLAGTAAVLGTGAVA